MSWAEYGDRLAQLVEKIKSSEVLFDAVVPVLRSGMIPAGAIAIQLGINKIIPVQFKYLHNPARLECKIAVAPTEESFKNILICENNTSSGDTAEAVIRQVKNAFPKSSLFYATLAKVYGGPDRFEGIQDYYFGVLTNERFVADSKQEQTSGLRRGVTIFPWENLNDELREMNQTSSSHRSSV